MASINSVIEVIMNSDGAFGDIKVRKIKDQIEKRDGEQREGRGVKDFGKDYVDGSGIDSLLGGLKIG